MNPELINYLTVLAWVGFLLSLVVIIARCHAENWYKSNCQDAVTQRAADQVNGIERVYPLNLWITIFIFTGSFLISHYLF